jgi:hypothetical protein
MLWLFSAIKDLDFSPFSLWEKVRMRVYLLGNPHPGPLPEGEGEY